MMRWFTATRVHPEQIIQDQPTQETAGLPMEDHQPAAQTPVTAPRRGVFRAIRRFFKRKNKVHPPDTNLEGPTQDRAGSSAQDPQPAVRPLPPPPQREVQRADRKNRVVPLNSNQERSTLERAGKDAFGKYYNREI